MRRPAAMGDQTRDTAVRFLAQCRLMLKTAARVHEQSIITNDVYEDEN